MHWLLKQVALYIQLPLSFKWLICSSEFSIDTDYRVLVAGIRRNITGVNSRKSGDRVSIPGRSKSLFPLTSVS
jgi:hypothetical protein